VHESPGLITEGPLPLADLRRELMKWHTRAVAIFLYGCYANM